jgi:hypothetical protein
MCILRNKVIIRWKKNSSLNTLNNSFGTSSVKFEHYSAPLGSIITLNDSVIINFNSKMFLTKLNKAKII